MTNTREAQAIDRQRTEIDRVVWARSSPRCPQGPRSGLRVDAADCANFVSADGPVATEADGGLVARSSVLFAVVVAFVALGITLSASPPIRAEWAPITGITEISAGVRQTCAVADGGAWCWGDNEFGQLGNGGYAGSGHAVAVDGLSTGVAAISSGALHVCALEEAGRVWCWGYNEFGDRRTPTQAVGFPEATAISAGYAHTCALTAAGEVWCWGSNEFGQLGDGTITYRWTPVVVLNRPGFFGDSVT